MYQPSFSFNGIKKAFVITEEGRKHQVYNVKRNLLYIPGLAGALLDSTDQEVKIIQQPITILSDSKSNLRKMEEELSNWLLTDKPVQLIFDEEMDRVYNAVVDGSLDIEDIVSSGRGTITFICPDPYKYSTEEKSISWPELKVFKQDFVGKVAHSTLENPHIFRRTHTNNGQTLFAPSGITYEDPAYSDLMTLGGGLRTSGRTGVGHMEQHLMSFNLIAAIERRFGAIPATDKVAWLRANIKKLTANWWGKGTNKMSNPNGKADFAGKVAGSTTENPHKMMFSNSYPTLINPSQFTAEGSQSHYNDVTTLNGNVFASAAGTSGNISQQIYSFNLIEYVKRKYGYTPTVQWLKDNISKLACNWHGYGTGVAGNKAFINLWRGDTSAWYSSPRSHSGSNVTKMVFDTTAIGTFVTNDGFFHVVTYGEPTDGVTNSYLRTDFVELEVELKPGADKATISVWNNDISNWSAWNTNTTNSIVLRAATITTNIPSRITGEGFMHILAHAEPSNGIAPSTIETDFIELEIETNVPYLPIVVNNKGTADAKPIFTAMVKSPITHLDIVTEEGYMRIGEPVNIEETPVEREQLILKEPLKTTTGWATANDVDGGSVAGTMVSDGETFRAQSYGTGSLWHGPALKRSLPEQIQDFKVDMYASLKTKEVREAGRLELYFKDINDKTLGKLALKELLTASDSVHGEARAGSIDGGKFLISTDGATPGVWNQFYGILRFTRIGDRLQAYIAKIDTATGNRHTRWLSKEIIDSQGLFQSKLAQIQIHIGQHGSKAFVQDIGVHEVQVYKINQTTETQIPYIAYPGDIIEIDMVENDIRINGESRMDLKDFGSSFFALQPGENVITYSNYDVVDLKIDWREPFK
ncbi:phage tail family protein [Cytobacillus oceanisediminis]|uniref:distal tail protein Dit n=1 Tax=Cytobacillus oceanisediminis TaxID=665099 RepID=UPI00203DE638|nr:distal tail protein Dit [Cytobacillus oceanisediminis]MCM3242684.1 phage tail family protein [Cytobacillus oceanisediminis]